MGLFMTVTMKTRPAVRGLACRQLLVRRSPMNALFVTGTEHYGGAALTGR